MRVLVTGLSGFTGWHLAKKLQTTGYDVLGLGSEASSIVPKYLRADLDETARISGWLSEVLPTHVIHLAALSHVMGNAIDFYRLTRPESVR